MRIKIRNTQLNIIYNELKNMGRFFRSMDFQLPNKISSKGSNLSIFIIICKKYRVGVKPIHLCTVSPWQVRHNAQIFFIRCWLTDVKCVRCNQAVPTINIKHYRYIQHSTQQMYMVHTTHQTVNSIQYTVKYQVVELHVNSTQHAVHTKIKYA